MKILSAILFFFVVLTLCGRPLAACSAGDYSKCGEKPPVTDRYDKKPAPKKPAPAKLDGGA